MGKKEVRREDIVEALKKIAFGRANHGVELAYLEKATPQRVQRMDLSAVAEFKRSANGAVEVKFVDRVMDGAACGWPCSRSGGSARG